MIREEIIEEINRLEPLYEDAYKASAYYNVSVFAKQIDDMINLLNEIDNTEEIMRNVEVCPSCGTTTDSHWESCANYDHEAYYHNMSDSSGIYPDEEVIPNNTPTGVYEEEEE